MEPWERHQGEAKPSSAPGLCGMDVGQPGITLGAAGKPSTGHVQSEQLQKSYISARRRVQLVENPGKSTQKEKIGERTREQECKGALGPRPWGVTGGAGRGESRALPGLRVLLSPQGSAVSFGNAISKNFPCLQTTLLVISRLKFLLR